MLKGKRTAVVGEECVACGNCIKYCPLHAVTVPLGITAVVDEDKCVGCGKCAKNCPAEVISIRIRTEV
ncbi:ferredoxin [Anaerocolumna cellulosilytica]|uniref:Ferredoxin n=1 Tax=Anaerocolumna cellulosilytica TaxID=433286 RepID=A0A6S6R5N6_9FIRM|nr:4Fe-4S binding protein [Anaerocolumna cellulosilytica]MBB5194143.1 ferredoxin [Anaerocolumna cellulosilytica]BCJ94645.1 ferredoxin [Anaerocolumna cellulosilytica]